VLSFVFSHTIYHIRGSVYTVYSDGLLLQLRNSDIGCYIGNCFVGALAYADDLALLAHSASATRTLLKICDDYSKQFSLVFNAAKSALSPCHKQSIIAASYEEA